MTQEFKESVTITFERYQAMIDEIDDLKYQVENFRDLFSLTVKDEEMVAIVKKSELEHWATLNVYIGDNFLTRKRAQSLIIKLEGAE